MDSSLIFLFEIQAYCGYIIIRLGDANKKKKSLCLDAGSWSIVHSSGLNYSLLGQNLSHESKHSENA
jgi:hypothetical protein